MMGAASVTPPAPTPEDSHALSRSGLSNNHSSSAAAAPTLNRRNVVAALASTAALSITQLSAPEARAEAGASTATKLLRVQTTCAS